MINFHAGMAQLVEQLNRNQQVGGSIPSSSTIEINNRTLEIVSEFLLKYLPYFDILVKIYRELEVST